MFPTRACARLSRWEWWLALALGMLTFGVGYLNAPLGENLGFVDMAHDGYQLRLALDLSHGAVIFRDTFDQYGALYGYLNTLGFVTLGHTLLAMKYFVVGWYGLTGVVLYVLARHWLRPALAAFSVLLWLGLAPFYQHGIMLSPHAYVLFLQAVATIVILESPGLESRNLVIAGVLTGLSFGMKQTMATFYAAAVLAYLLCLLLSRRATWPRLTAAAASFGAGYGGVIAVMLGVLWSRGALHDWYLQTVAFPRDGYAGGGINYVAFLTAFFRLQATQSLYWFVIRGVVVVAAMTQLVRRTANQDFLFIASLTGFLWLGAFPSAAFMHQWWTVSLSIPAFVAAAYQAALWLGPRHERIAALGTMMLTGLTVEPGVAARLSSTAGKLASASHALTEPAVLRGIRTDAQTERAFSTALRLMNEYRQQHPGTKIVSASSPASLTDKSLLFLSFVDGNTHSGPVYWTLPVLTTTTYPHYLDDLRKEISATHPLIIAFREGGGTPASVPEYSTIFQAETDFGAWYLYAPDPPARELHRESPVFLPRRPPPVAPPVVVASAPVESPIGPWRGLVTRQGGAVNVFTWPSTLPAVETAGRTEPFSEEPIGQEPILHRVASDAFEIDGSAARPFSYLAYYRDQELAEGTRLRIRGELFEGGLQPGFLRDGQWCCSVAITLPGRFEAVIRIPRSGTYQLVLGNVVETTKWQILRAHWLRGAVNLFRGSSLPNRFSISRVEWLR